MTDTPAPTPRRAATAERLAEIWRVAERHDFTSPEHMYWALRDIIPAYDTLTAQLAASEAAREKLTADIAAVRATVAVRTAREHRAGCPALHAWDVPGACVCDNPEISRCGVCGHRVAHPAPDAGGRNG